MNWVTLPLKGLLRVAIVKPLGTRLPPWLTSCHDEIVSLRNRTEPSAKPKLAPPGWKLEAESTMMSPWLSSL